MLSNLYLDMLITGMLQIIKSISFLLKCDPL